MANLVKYTMVGVDLTLTTSGRWVRLLLPAGYPGAWMASGGQGMVRKASGQDCARG